MKLRTGALVIACAFPLPALAQDFSGAVTLGYGLGELSDFDQKINSLTFSGAVNVQLDSNWSLGLRANYAAIDIKNLPVDVSANLLGANVAYAFGNGAWVGVYTENSEVSVDLLPINFGVTDFGVEGGYNKDGVEVSAFLGKSTDITSIGIGGKYALSEQAVVGASAIRSSLDFAGLELDVTAVGLAAAWTSSQGWGVFGGATRSSISDIDADLTTIGLGASYTFSAGNNPVAVSLEMARSDIEVMGFGTDFDTVRLGVTIPFGNKGTVAPKNSVADAILNPTHSAVSQTILAAF